MTTFNFYKKGDFVLPHDINTPNYVAEQEQLIEQDFELIGEPVHAKSVQQAHKKFNRAQYGKLDNSSVAIRFTILYFMPILSLLGIIGALMITLEISGNIGLSTLILLFGLLASGYITGTLLRHFLANVVDHLGVAFSVLGFALQLFTFYFFMDIGF